MFQWRRTALSEPGSVTILSERACGEIMNRLLRRDLGVMLTGLSRPIVWVMERL